MHLILGGEVKNKPFIHGATLLLATCCSMMLQSCHVDRRTDRRIAHAQRGVYAHNNSQVISIGGYVHMHMHTRTLSMISVCHHNVSCPLILYVLSPIILQLLIMIIIISLYMYN